MRNCVFNVLLMQVMRFTRIIFGCTVFEGYGQTESVAGVTMTSPGEVTGGRLYM